MRSYLNALIGNDSIRERLGLSVEHGTLSHAFLIEGPAGSGKHTLALELASALNCEKRDDSTSPLPCHSCNTCRRIAARGFTDVKYLSKAKDKATIGINELKLFKEDMYLSATESDYKVYVIENAELLTPQAQNALLIVLEEPPKNVVIILLSEQADKLLTTIKSRVQYVAMGRFATGELGEIVSKLSSEAVSMKQRDPDGYKGLLLAADGCIGRAFELLSPKLADGNRERREATERFVRRMTAKTPYSEILQSVSDLSTKRAELSSELEEIILALRDLISVKVHANAQPLFFTSEDKLLAIAKTFDAKRLFALYEIFSIAYEDNQKNANITTLTTNLAAKIKGCR